MGSEKLQGRPDNAHKTALITGASSGMGAEFARQLAARGYDLVLVARRGARLEALAGDLSTRHAITAEPLVADLADPAGVERVEQCIGQLGSLALLVNNAGFDISGSFSEAELQGQIDILNVHMVASMRLSHAVLPGMIAQGSGGIINVASLMAFMAVPGNVNYCATKAYLATFSRALAAEVKRKGVKVQVLCPGFTLTEFHDKPGQPGAGRAGIPRFLWGPAQAVVADSLRALDRGQTICVPGFINHVIFWLARLGVVDALVPRILVR